MTRKDRGSDLFPVRYSTISIEAEGGKVHIPDGHLSQALMPWLDIKGGFLVANFSELRSGEVRAEGRAGKAGKPVPRRWVKKGPVGREDEMSVPDRVMASIVHGRGPLVL